MLIFKVLKKEIKPCLSRILHPVKVSIENVGKIKTDSDLKRK